MTHRRKTWKTPQGTQKIEIHYNQKQGKKKERSDTFFLTANQKPICKFREKQKGRKAHQEIQATRLGKYEHMDSLSKHMDSLSIPKLTWTGVACQMLPKLSREHWHFASNQTEVNKYMGATIIKGNSFQACTIILQVTSLDHWRQSSKSIKSSEALRKS